MDREQAEEHGAGQLGPQQRPNAGQHLAAVNTARAIFIGGREPQAAAITAVWVEPFVFRQLPLAFAAEQVELAGHFVEAIGVGIGEADQVKPAIVDLDLQRARAKSCPSSDRLDLFDGNRLQQPGS